MSKQVLGNNVKVTFTSLGGKTVEGKVDTGATVSSLHATNIKVNGNRVQFVCELISPNVLTMDLEDTQDVHTADAGSSTRAVIRLPVQINGTEIANATFNLNDRSNMDSQVLIGQNILQAGDFVIDPSAGEEQISEAEKPKKMTKAEKLNMIFGQYVDAIDKLQEVIKQQDRMVSEFKQQVNSLLSEE